METHVFLKQASAQGSLAELYADAADPSAQEQGIAGLGGKVIFQAAVAGAYDFVLIAQLPDYGAVVAVSLQCNQRGIHTTGLHAYSSEQAAAALGAQSTKDSAGPAEDGDPIYVVLKQAMLQGSLRDLLADGADPTRLERQVSELGGRVLFQSALSGPYDFVLVAQLPGERSVGAVSISCNGVRGVRATVLRAYSTADAAQAGKVPF